MRILAIAVSFIALGACSFVTIADRYGNEYGDWYNPGGNYRWQLGVCEHDMEARGIAPSDRKLEMRCCMRDHGVPGDSPPACHA